MKECQSLSNKSGMTRLTSLHPVRIMPTLSFSRRISNMSFTPDSPAVDICLYSTLGLTFSWCDR
jgi:hypothetical protein